MTRDDIITDALATGSDPVAVAGLTVRPVTFATLLMLRKLANPIAAALESGRDVDAGNVEAIVEILWVQCAPWDDVRRIVCAQRPGGDRSVLDAALIDFALTLTPATVQAAVEEITRQQRAVAAAAAEVLPDGKRRDSKN